MNLAADGERRHQVARSAIEDELGAFFHARTAVAQTYGDEFVRLWALAGESVLGGKLVRPLLLVATYDALHPIDAAIGDACGGGSVSVSDDDIQDECGCDRDTVIRIASAIEVLHYSFLLHDDVIDGDLTRRGRPNLIGALLADASHPARTSGLPSDAEGAASSATELHWARTGGILMGDLLLASTHQTFARVCLKPAVRLRLLDLLEHTIMESVAGEQLDVGLGGGLIAPELATILAMSTYKTATYTFELPLRAAAILAGADAPVADALSAAGRHLGLAFQLQDDLLSTFGDPDQHGKDSFSDLREGKQTALIAYARLTDQWSVIEPLFGQRNLISEAGIRLQELLVSCGAEQFVRLLIDEQLSAFFKLLDTQPTEIPAQVRRVLVELASRLEHRQS